MAVEHFRNRHTGITWSANPGTAEHTRMARDTGEFERIEPAAPEPKPKRRRKTPEPHPGGIDEFAPREEAEQS